jgi:hypothetical protein
MLKIVKFAEKAGEVYLNDGVIHVNREKPEFGSIMVKSTPTFKKGGNITAFALQTRTAFYTDRIERLKMLDLKDGDSLDELFDTKLRIVQVETTDAEAIGFRPLLNPSTNNVVVTVDGEPIYWQTKIVTDEDGEQDTMLERAPAEIYIEKSEFVTEND